jgi:archaellum component FlaF (FlaF/FlaG flagellin family)
MIKILGGILTVMLLATFYVCQHAKLVEYSYAINASQQDISLLIDQNNALRYNISRLESPGRLHNHVSVGEQVDTYIPIDSYSLTVQKPAALNDAMVYPALPARIPGLLLSMFLLNDEAIAIE